MYNLADNIKKLFYDHYREIAEIKFNGVEDSFTITESDIVQGGLSVNRYCTSSSRIEIGSAIASELVIRLNNRDGKFDEIAFEGAELYAKIGIKKWDANKWEKAQIHYIPLGYFTIDNTPRKHSTIEITALDRMLWFDRLVDKSKFFNGMTVNGIVRTCCSECGVILATNIAPLPNSEYVVPTFPVDENELTYRKLIQWCAALMGVCAYVDWNGELRMEWYSDNSTGERITKADRYTSDIYENDITITGVYVADDNDNEYIAGTAEYALTLESNSLIQHDYQAVVDAIFARVGGFTYRPYSCSIKPNIWLYPLDMITFVDKKGGEHATIITDITFKMNGRTSLKGQGETATENEYYTPSMTEQASSILKRQKQEIERLSDKEQALLHLNQVMGNAMGLYFSPVEENGATKYYYHDAQFIQDSNIIYTFNSDGFAWTYDWNNGNPVWQYGIDKSGNAILNYLSVNKLTADYIDTETLNVVDIINKSTKVLYITSNRLVIDSDNFKLTETGDITANSGTIAGFTISEDKLTNSDGMSSIEIVNSAGYKLTVAATGINMWAETSTGLNRGWGLSSTQLSLTEIGGGSIISSIYVKSSYKKRSSAYSSTSADGKNTTVYEGCITGHNSVKSIDSTYQADATPFIIGQCQDFRDAPYASVYDWGSYLRFVSFARVEIVYDSQLGSKWVVKDKYTGDEIDFFTVAEIEKLRKLI